MTPVEQAKALCEARGENFLYEIEAFLLTGFVFSTPTLFAMGRPVPRTAEISDPWQTWPEAECDAWFVWCAVGDLAALVALIPHPLPWVGWVRQGRDWRQPHWVSFGRVQSALDKRRKSA